MIPKLALNFLINKDTNVKDLPQLFEKMKWNKVIYVEVLVRDMDTIDKLGPIISAFRKMRSVHSIDYTIWIDISTFGLAYEKAADLFRIASSMDRLVMGICGTTEIMGLPNYRVTLGQDRQPDLHEIMSYHDEAALAYSQKAVGLINAPDGMKRGLERVVNDYIKLYGQQVLRSEEQSEISDQESE